jgi:ADP-ribose pyrophosphatase YjhB (NUDIX family)
MITFDIGATRFNLRVAGVAVAGDRVLLHRAERDDFWTFPGGRPELSEPLADALRREIREEVGVEIRVERLLWVVENFFELNAKKFHELAFYFLMAFSNDSSLYAKSESFYGEESAYAQEKLRLIFQWHPISELENTRLYPSFLRFALRSIPKETQHIVHTDTENS